MNFRCSAYLSMFLLTGCTNAVHEEGGSADQAASGQQRDHGAPSDVYPAFKSDAPHIKTNDGSVLTDPSIVTVTWSSDPNAQTFEDFGDALGTSDYWHAATYEYGVGPASSGSANHVRITTAPPAATTDDDLEKFIAKNVESSETSGWSAWDDQKIYILYVPHGVKVTSKDTGKDECEDSDGFHTEVKAGSHRVVYALVNENCNDDKTKTTVDVSTVIAAHELVEAATNPHVDTDEAWVGFDDVHQAYDLFQDHESEIADACEFFDDATYKETGPGFPFVVQRIWSNASAAAGHNPCVPLDGKVYFNVAPQGLEIVKSRQPDHGYKDTYGYAVGVGKNKQIALGFFSDAATGAWTISAAEGDGMSTPDATHLTLSIDKATGKNGEKAWLTVHAKSAGPKEGTLVTLVSTLGETKHYMPILIQTN